MQLITCKKQSSVLNPKSTQLNNMVDEITWKSIEFPIVFLMATQNQLLSMYLVKLQMYMSQQMTFKDVTELVNLREIQRKLFFALITENISNVPKLIGRT